MKILYCIKRKIAMCVSFIILTLLLSNINVAYAANYTAEEVADLILYDIDKEAATLRRIDALIAVMNAMGMSNYDAQMYSPYATDVSDWADSSDVLPWDRDFWSGYVYIARLLLLFGEDVLLEDGSVGTYCDVLSDATSGTCVAFMMRALSDENQIDTTNIDILYDLAKSCGLLKYEDAFYNDPNYTVSVIEFRELLIRFLNQNMYNYYGELFYREICEKDDYTYLQFLNETEDSWLNKEPRVEYRETVVNTNYTDSIVAWQPLAIDDYLENGVTYYPICLVAMVLNSQTGGGRIDSGEDNSYIIDNGMGDIAIVYPGSDIVIKNGVEYKLSVPTMNYQNIPEFGVTEEVLQLIYNDKVDISYYVNKMYYCITADLIL